MDEEKRFSSNQHRFLNILWIAVEEDLFYLYSRGGKNLVFLFLTKTVVFFIPIIDIEVGISLP